MKLILMIASLFLLSGCTTTKPSVTEYRVVAKNINTNSRADGYLDKSLKVSQAFSSSVLMSLKMNYGQDENKIFSYTESQWSETPNHAITLQIYEKVRDSNLFKNVQISKSRSNGDLILEINIEDFMQYYSEDLKESYANVVISLTLIDLKTREVLSAKTFKSKVNSTTLNADGGVEALNASLSNVLEQSLEWLNGVCK
ncbi:membrane integrity-associated transporter subunit PqiC [Candidatus Sulfurimonas marisnigri]|uniref:Membrane integrity-associated transporter subunit PqiC n=1 Tax=Candidatus Sulfurimonas marisnigri TaxID=2740405 RepID=A0A7S7RPZ6_9BACT|nr:ABC-type transport auxiliary lipoprotein family protein [Candidatus Sulfurimonas marisnigri]QOY54146.1 membrane integrity-associated transporter subunit PqiC [Candidatus Sulfurimonas marisnigri]